MSKKAKLSLALVGVIVLVSGAVLVSKSNSGYVDGKYVAEGSEYDKKGWKPTLEITIENEKIVDVVFDYVNKDTGGLKTEDEQYNKTMLSAADCSPTIFAKEFAVELIIKQNVDDFDGTSGATASTKDFVQMAEKLLLNAKSGKTDKEILDISAH